jgi:enamine deaminase RidA (YjgF/YER057c/UK114 family)
MEMKQVNPWTWQDAFGFSQAIEFRGHSRVLTCAGQTSVDDNGSPLHEGDMAAQIGQALDNIETVLKQAGMTLSNVVHLNYYTTDIDSFLQHSGVAAQRLKEANYTRRAHCSRSSALPSHRYSSRWRPRRSPERRPHADVGLRIRR